MDNIINVANSNATSVKQVIKIKQIHVFFFLISTQLNGVLSYLSFI